MPRFVILEHDAPFLHWDFMLEVVGGLRTWRLMAPPSAEQPIDAVPLGLHRLAYLDYEGPVSGNRGTVAQWDRGDFDGLVLEDDKVIVRIHGGRVDGTMELKRVGEKWSLHFTANKQPHIAG
jgi:hypothetical protein